MVVGEDSEKISIYTQHAYTPTTHKFTHKNWPGSNFNWLPPTPPYNYFCYRCNIKAYRMTFNTNHVTYHMTFNTNHVTPPYNYFCYRCNIKAYHMTLNTNHVTLKHIIWHLIQTMWQHIIWHLIQTMWQC